MRTFVAGAIVAGAYVGHASDYFIPTLHITNNEREWNTYCPWDNITLKLRFRKNIMYVTEFR